MFEDEYNLAKIVEQSFAQRTYPKRCQLKQYKFNSNYSSNKELK